MSQRKTIDFEKIVKDHFIGESKYAIVLSAMKEACKQAIEIALEDAAKNCKYIGSQNEILSRKEVLFNQLKLK